MSVVGYQRREYKRGRSVGRLRLTLTAHHACSIATPFADPLAPLDLADTDGLIVVRSDAPPLTPPLGDLLRHRTISTRSCSSSRSPSSSIAHPNRPNRQVPRPRRLAFVGWGGEVGEPTE
jgi:hypothetical protein